MKKLMMVVVCLLALGLSASAQSGEKTWHSGKAVESEMAAGANVEMRLSSGDATVNLSADAKKITFTPESTDEAELAKFKMTVSTKAGKTLVNVEGPHNHARYRIEMPQPANLKAHLSAGDLHVTGVACNTDITMHAGDLNIELAASPEEFGPVDLSTKIGDVSASKFHAEKGGFFRHVHETAAKKYKLKAHVGTGDLTVK